MTFGVRQQYPGGTGRARGARRAAGPPAEPGLPAVAKHLTEQAERAIERADGKAATLAATATAILAFSVQGGMSPGGRLPSATAAAVLLAAGALCWVVGIVALAMAIFPRFADSGDARLTYFKQFPEPFDPAALQALARAADDDRERWLLAQAHALSRIAATKYRFIRLGMQLLGAGVPLALCGLLLA